MSVEAVDLNILERFMAERNQFVTENVFRPCRRRAVAVRRRRIRRPPIQRIRAGAAPAAGGAGGADHDDFPWSGQWVPVGGKMMRCNAMAARQRRRRSAAAAANGPRGNRGSLSGPGPPIHALHMQITSGRCRWRQRRSWSRSFVDRPARHGSPITRFIIYRWLDWSCRNESIFGGSKVHSHTHTQMALILPKLKKYGQCFTWRLLALNRGKKKKKLKNTKIKSGAANQLSRSILLQTATRVV